MYYILLHIVSSSCIMENNVLIFSYSGKYYTVRYRLGVIMEVTYPCTLIIYSLSYTILPLQLLLLRLTYSISTY